MGCGENEKQCDRISRRSILGTGVVFDRELTFGMDGFETRRVETFLCCPQARGDHVSSSLSLIIRMVVRRDNEMSPTGERERGGNSGRLIEREATCSAGTG